MPSPAKHAPFLSRGPHYCVAPMVNQSELAFRMLCRRHGATVAYTPMCLAAHFVRDARYRRMVFQTAEGDRPLVVQLAGNDPSLLVQAALMVQDDCDAVDLNLGCPQDIAFQGDYGAALMDRWDTVEAIVRALSAALRVPVCCKIRVYDDVARTVAYARMLVAAGCRCLAVHGRTVDQRGSGLANWTTIRAVVEAVDVPVLANGNIRHWQDIGDCLRHTGAVGVMSAESLLGDPALFAPHLGHAAEPPSDGRQIRLAREYLAVAAEHPPCSARIVRRHLFHLLTALLHRNTDVYDTLFATEDLRVMTTAVDTLEARARQGIAVDVPRANGRPRKRTSQGLLYPPPIGGIGEQEEGGGSTRKRKR
jgi:tRNA-dihydrouridine synthase 1